MKKVEVVELFKKIVDVYPRFEVTSGKVDTWHWLMDGIPYEAAKRNLLNHCRTSRFEPTIADIVGNSKPKEYKSNSFDAEEMLKGMKW